MKNQQKLFISALSLAGISAAIGSLCIGLYQSVWFDEAYSILLAEHSWTDIVRLTAQDVHPPLYYWLLKAWMLLFGSSEVALRSMSALFLGLAIVCMGLLVRRLFGTKAALVTLPFLVFAPFLLRYGFEIRMYSLVSFIGVTATYTLVCATQAENVQKQRLLFFVYALLVAAGVYTLYFTALIWIAHLLWLGWLSFKEKRKDIAILGVLAYGSAFLLFIPWLPVFLGKAGGGTLSGVTHSLGFENLVGISSFLFLYQPSWKVTGVCAVIICLVVVMSILLAWIGRKQTAENERSSLVLLVAYWCVPIVVLAIVTHFLPIYIERYFAHFALAMYATIGVVVALALRDRRKRASVVIIAILLFVVQVAGCYSLIQFGNYNFQRIHTPTMKQIAAQLDDCKNGAIIFADGPQSAMELMYYTKDCPVYFFNETLEMGGGFAMLSGTPFRVADASELPQTNEILFVYYDKPKRNLPPAFKQEDKTTFGAVTVATYRRTSAAL